MQKLNNPVAGFFTMLVRSTLAKVALSFIAILALLFVLLGGPPAGALAQDEPTATETLAAFDTETLTPLPSDTPAEPTATEEPTLAADTATEEPTATETLAESETPTVDLSLTVTPTITETPTETPTLEVSCTGLGVDELCDLVAEIGQVRVIVELEMPYTPPAQLSNAAENAQENAIENNQEALADEMAVAESVDEDVEAEAISEFETLPYAAYVVNEAGLAELATSPFVANVFQDHPNPISLDGSVPLIEAPAAHANGFSGAGQTIAILDTGVQLDHPMFDFDLVTGGFQTGKIVAEGCFSEEVIYGPDVPPDYDIESFCPGDVAESPGAGGGPCDINPDCYHGTHVAGIAAGDNGSLFGVAPEASIIAVQVFSGHYQDYWCGPGQSPCALAWDSDMINGMEYVLSLQGSTIEISPGVFYDVDIAAVNMSIGGGGFSSTCNNAYEGAGMFMKAAIDSLRAAGIATVISAGNDGFTNKLSYPACISSAISVGATNGVGPTDTIAAFSNRASFLTLYAPGVNINSSIPTNAYDSWDGTSMAAPHVAGAFAVLQDYANGLMSVTDATNFLKNNGDPVTGSSIKRINVWKAILANVPDPGKPNLLTLANNIRMNDNTPALTWSAVANALDYEVQVSLSNTFGGANEFYSVEDFPGETVTLPTVSPDNKFYWRVRGLNLYDEPGPWSTTFNFTVDTIPASMVFLSLPADGSTVSTIIPKLTWLAVPDAVKYDVQVSEDGTWSTIDMDHQNITGLFYQLTNAEALHTDQQYWRVRSIDIAGNPSAWGPGRTFTPLLLQSPTNGAFTTDMTPLLKWLAATGALQIEVELDNNADFLSPEVDPPPFAATLLQYQAPDLALGLQYWRMKIETTAAGWSEWSPVWTFTISNPAPAITVLTSPLANALINDTTPDLGWNAVAGADHYQLQIDNTATFASPEVDDSAVPSTSTTSPLALGQGVQNWRVRAIDVLNQPGPWSVARKFTVDSIAPVAPVLSMPVDSVSSMGNPTFTWTKPADMVQSRLELDFGSCPNDFVVITYEGPWGAVVSFKPTSVQFGGTGDFCWRITGKDAAGNLISSAARDVEILEIVPIAPGPITLSNMAITNNPQPVFNWGGVAYAANYEIQIDNNSNFMSIAPTETEIGSDTTFTPTALADGLYYWRVRAINLGTTPGPFSAVRTFTVDTVAPVDQPDLMMPLDSVVGVGNPTFTWTKPTDGTQTCLVIDEDGGDWSSPLLPCTWGTVLSLKPTPAQLSYIGLIQWKVQGRDSATNPSPDSIVRDYIVAQAAPVAPVLTSPALNSFSADLTPDFAWNASLRADYYRIQIDTAMTFNTVNLVDQALASGVTTFTPGSDLPQAKLYWRVRGENSNSSPMVSPWSVVRAFTVDSTDPLTAAVLNLPVAGGSSVGNPTFTWSKPATATQTRLLVDEAGGGFALPLFTSAWGTVVSLKPTTTQLNYFGDVIWTVESRDAAGNAGGPEDPGRAFLIHAPTPAKPVLTSPANNGFTNNLDLIFDWANVPNAIGYQIQIATDAAFTSLFDDDSMANSEYDSPLTLAPNTVYFWRARARNVTNVYGPYSTTFKFTTDNIAPAAVPVLGATPANGSTSVGNPNFTWMAVSGASQYRLEIDLNDNFSNVEWDSGWLTATSHKPTPLLFSELGEIDWRVRARDAAGNEGSTASFERSVTITVPVPTNVPTLITPANNAVFQNHDPNFSWTEVPYGSYYEIWVATSSTFATGRIIDYEGDIGDENTSFQVGVDNFGVPASLPDGVYYWWVWGYNYNDQHSAAWSTKFKFTIDSTAPPLPNLTGPASLFIARNTAPTFTWAAAAGATQYEVQYDQVGDGFSSVEYTSGWISGTSHHPASPPNFGIYEWRVWTRDAAGNVSATPVLVRTFIEVTEALPPAPVLASPATNAMTTDNTPSLFWNSVAAADTYEIQIDNNSNFSSPEATGSGLAGLNFTSSLIPNGTYYWRVRGVNSTADGPAEAGPWSLVRILKIVP